MSFKGLPSYHEIVWDPETQDYILEFNPKIEPITYLEPGDVYPEEAFYDPKCMINCFKCMNIDGLDEGQVLAVCECADAWDHNLCFLCYKCYAKLKDKYFILNQEAISDHSKKRKFIYTPCGEIIDFEN
jgi:hypothetical protein